MKKDVLFSFTGTKYKLLDFLKENIKFNPEKQQWYEPFCGSCVVGLNFTSTTTILLLLAAVLILPGIIYCLCKIPALSSRKGEMILQNLIHILINVWFVIAPVFCIVLIIKLILSLMQ